VNRIGTDGNGVDHSGDSVVLDPLGGVISDLRPKKQGICTVELDWKALQDLRKRFPVLTDADDFGWSSAL
jgi:predicted amidohydrolase